MDVVGKIITKGEVYIADEVFFTGTSAEVLPVRELDGRTIGSGKREAVTEKLQSMYFDPLIAARKENPKWSMTVN